MMMTTTTTMMMTCMFRELLYCELSILYTKWFVAIVLLHCHYQVAPVLATHITDCYCIDSKYIAHLA